MAQTQNLETISPAAAGAVWGRENWSWLPRG